MLRTFKWLWDKAQHYGEERIIALVHSRAEYHRLMAETAYLRQQHEPEKDDEPMRRFERPRYSAKEHSVINSALNNILTDYYREQEHKNEVIND